MNIYVKSRGVSKGYSWSDKNQQEIANPPMLKEAIQIVDSDDFSLVLYRLEGRLSLLITGLETKNRTDNRTRRIRNSVLWVGDNSDEATLRAMSIQALNGELENKVDQAVISENNDQGFRVDFEKLTTENIGLQSVENSPADSNKIGNLSACKDNLIGDLKKYSLPQHDGMLVVVSSTVSQSNLEQNQVWRGLSDTISDDEWIELSGNAKEDTGDNFRLDSTAGKVTSPENSTQQSIRPKNKAGNTTNDKIHNGVIKKPRLTIFITVFIVFFLVISNIVFYLKWQDAIENKKEYEKLLEKSEALKIEIGNNENKIKNQEQKIDEQNLNIKKGDKILNEIINFTAKFNSQEGRRLLEDTNNFLNGIQK